eukprot:COSAG02_NODE_531_length_20680_cov_851.251834_3_plen_179_part_00
MAMVASLPSSVQREVGYGHERLQHQQQPAPVNLLQHEHEQPQQHDDRFSQSPPEDGQSLQDDASLAGLADQAIDIATGANALDVPPVPTRMRRQNSESWQLVDEGDRIACVMVTGNCTPSSTVTTNGKEAFGLEVDLAWHAQLESLIEMGYGVKAAAEALRCCDGHLLEAFKFLECRR